MTKKSANINHYHFETFQELIALKLTAGVKSPGHAVKLHLGDLLGKRGFGKPNDNRLLQWQQFFEHIQKTFYGDLEVRLTKTHEIEGLIKTTINSNWSNSRNTTRSHEAFVIYYWVHLTPEYESVARKIDEDVIGAPFAEVFDKPLPFTTTEAVELYDQMREARNADKRHSERSEDQSTKQKRPIEDSPQDFVHGHYTSTSELHKFNRLNPSYPSLFKLPIYYQAARAEFITVKESLLTEDSNSASRSMTVYGAGGYGKSALAQEICNDNEIRARFFGGIYWLQFGLTDRSKEKTGVVQLQQAIERMFAAQYPRQAQPALVFDTQPRPADILLLASVLPGSPLLLVADDLWTRGQSDWLASVPGHISILITTRRQSVASQATHKVPIGPLTDGAAVKLLTHGIGAHTEKQELELKTLAKKFKGWALLLGLANGVFRNLGGGSPPDVDIAIEEYKSFFAEGDIGGWDIEELEESEIEKRRGMVAYCIEVGLKAIDQNNQPELLRLLAIFPVDVEIPFSAIVDLWREETGIALSQTTVRSRLLHFNDFSFFSAFGYRTGTLRLHDEILAYFRRSLGLNRLRAAHETMLASIKRHCSGGWHTLPETHQYGWKQLLYHLEQADNVGTANELRTDFGWIKNKLEFVGLSELLRSYVSNMLDDASNTVWRAIAVSAPVLVRRPGALVHQLFGRLAYNRSGRIADMIKSVEVHPTFMPQALWPHLDTLGREIFRIRHSDHIKSAVFSNDDTIILTVSG